MKRSIIAMIALVLCASPAMPQAETAAGGMGWSAADITALRRWVKAAPLDALPEIPTAALDQAMTRADPARIDDEATMLALRLARMHLLGSASAGERSGWNITDSDRELALEPLLARAVANDTLDMFFALLRPAHGEYSALKAAYASETDPDRRRTIARNMERWRWLPRSLGEDYVLVNTARFEARLWRGGTRSGTWRVIVGKRSTPTPVFDATITGVTFNPWWEIPASIVRESVGALVRRNPALARTRGYVWGGGRYRQRPGPDNALGQMKLVMPNRFSVYMHDTPARHLFEREVRAFSHGCIRTQDAIGFAATLLEGARTRAQIDAILASGQTVTVDLPRPLPIYVAYFTAVGDDAGGVAILDDIYGRDRRIAAVPAGGACAA